jgi:hypothetical protein
MQRPKLSGDRVGTRWWYWIAAVPTVFAFWLVTVAWVAFAIWMDPALTVFPGPDDPLRNAVFMSLVAVGVPFVVLTAMLPMAVLQDVAAIGRADVGWEPPGSYAAVALAGWVLGGLVGLLTTNPFLALIVGFTASVPFALYYLRLRHRHIGVP